MDNPLTSLQTTKRPRVIGSPAMTSFHEITLENPTAVAGQQVILVDD
jgi:hypothetical protein